MNVIEIKVAQCEPNTRRSWPSGCQGFLRWCQRLNIKRTIGVLYKHEVSYVHMIRICWHKLVIDRNEHKIRSMFQVDVCPVIAIQVSRMSRV